MQEQARARVAVIGAGWAGLSAAVALCERNVPVTLFEASRNVGGRARRVTIENVALDNGQHIMVGAYRETLAIMRKVGVDPDQVLRRLPLNICYADGFRLRLPRLPYPFNLAAALLRANGVSIKEALSAVRFMRALKAGGFRIRPDRTVTRWLDEHDQRGMLRSRLWEPLCVSALNTPVHCASAQVFACVLRDALSGSMTTSDLLLARVDLGKIFPEPAAEFVRSRGGTVLLGSSVRTLSREGALFRVNDHPRMFSSVVIACAPQHALALLAGFPELQRTAALIAALDYEPIVTCYLKYAESVALAAPMMGLNGGMVQWVFDRGQLDAQKGLLAAVISASGPHEKLDKEQLIARLEAELRSCLAPLPALEWSRVITERRATFSCRVSLERPEARTAVPGLALAGDYVACDYPGTLESAVRSGLAAARAVAP